MKKCTPGLTTRSKRCSSSAWRWGPCTFRHPLPSQLVSSHPSTNSVVLLSISRLSSITHTRDTSHYSKVSGRLSSSSLPPTCHWSVTTNLSLLFTIISLQLAYGSVSSSWKLNRGPPILLFPFILRHLLFLALCHMIIIKAGPHLMFL